MDLQALVNKFKFIAGVYAFDILPDGSKKHENQDVHPEQGVYFLHDSRHVPSYLYALQK